MLGAPGEAERDAATLELLDYGLSLYRERTLVASGERIASARSLGTSAGGSPWSRASRSTFVARADQPVEVEFDPPPAPDGAVARGEPFGSAVVALDGREVGEVAVVAAHAVAAPAETGLPTWAWIVFAGGGSGRPGPGDGRDRRGEAPAPVVSSAAVILTVTLNAAIDRTVAVPNFRLSQRHRAVESQTVAGGKGVNVARALKLLGRPVIATGLTGGATGTRILEQLAEESILNDFTRIEGESRTNLSVVDPDHRRADRDQRARPAGDPGGDRPVRREAALPGAGRDDLRARGLDAARRRTRTCTPGW